MDSFGHHLPPQPCLQGDTVTLQNGYPARNDQLEESSDDVVVIILSLAN